MGNYSDNVRDGALSGFFSYGSANRIEGFGASDLSSLGVRWEEHIFYFYVRDSGASFPILLFICVS